jgi:hypothetical protein
MPGLGKSGEPSIEGIAGGVDDALAVNGARGVLDAVTDGLLVYVQSDVVRVDSRSLLGFDSESTFRPSSAICTPGRLFLSIQTVPEVAFILAEQGNTNAQAHG